MANLQVLNEQFVTGFITGMSFGAGGGGSGGSGGIPRVNNKLSVTFKNGNLVLEEHEKVPFGSTVVYEGSRPLKYGYSFIGWDPPPVNLVDDTVCIAQFEQDHDIPAPDPPIANYAVMIETDSVNSTDPTISITLGTYEDNAFHGAGEKPLIQHSAETREYYGVVRITYIPDTNRWKITALCALEKYKYDGPQNPPIYQATYSSGDDIELAASDVSFRIYGVPN